MKSKRVYVESGDADLQVFKESLPGLRTLCKNYKLADIWNSDETKLNYCMPRSNHLK